MAETYAPGTLITTERTKRGFFGWVFALVFWAWQLLMAAWLITSLNLTTGQYASATSDAARTGTAIGTTIGMTFLLLVWALGSLIFGMLMFFTRGKKTTVIRQVQ